MALRRAGLADADAVGRLHVASWRAAYQDELPAAYLDALDPAQRAVEWMVPLLRPDTVVMLAERDGEPLAFCASGPVRDRDLAGRAWEIYNLHVEPSRRGGGIGGVLFDHAVALGHDMTCDVLTLWVVEGNAPARRFYEGKRMVADGARQVLQVGPDAALREVRYRLPI